MKQNPFSIWLALVAILALATSQAETLPDGAEIVAAMRNGMRLEPAKYSAEIRDHKTGQTEKFSITVDQQSMRFKFDNPQELLQLGFSQTPFTFKHYKGGTITNVPVSIYKNQFRGSALNFQDVSLGYIFWTNPVVTRVDTIVSTKCWVLRLTNTNTSLPYGTVDVWVPQDMGGLLRVWAYDFAGKLVKKIELRSLQEVNGKKMPGTIRIEEVHPETRDVEKRSYLTLMPN